jgi:organic hydroperoxide reductase OsmC/OhrA
MPFAERTAETTWDGSLARGAGIIRPDSGAFDPRGRVPALDREGFQAAVDEAAALCPISRLFAGAKITVPAELESA